MYVKKLKLGMEVKSVYRNEKFGFFASLDFVRVAPC